MRSKKKLDPDALELPEPTAEDLAALERADQHEPDGPWPEPFEL